MMLIYPKLWVMVMADKHQNGKEKDKITFYKECMQQFMLNKMDDLEADRIAIENRVNFRKMDSDTYMDMKINEIRRDYARYLFRQINELMDIYL